MKVLGLGPEWGVFQGETSYGQTLNPRLAWKIWTVEEKWTEKEMDMEEMDVFKINDDDDSLWYSYQMNSLQ